MPSVKSIIVSLVSGAFFSAGWFILISGIIRANQSPATAPFWWYFAFPAIFVSITNVLMNLVNVSQLSSRSSVFDDGGNRKATVWFIITFAGSLCCIGGAVWVMVENYGVGSVGTEWPGVALLLQTILITISGMLFFFGRPKRSYLNV